jgi:hypothetical protein
MVVGPLLCLLATMVHTQVLGCFAARSAETLMYPGIGGLLFPAGVIRSSGVRHGVSSSAPLPAPKMLTAQIPRMNRLPASFFPGAMRGPRDTGRGQEYRICRRARFAPPAVVRDTEPTGIPRAEFAVATFFCSANTHGYPLCCNSIEWLARIVSALKVWPRRLATHTTMWRARGGLSPTS